MHRATFRPDLLRARRFQENVVRLSLSSAVLSRTRSKYKNRYRAGSYSLRLFQNFVSALYVSMSICKATCTKRFYLWAPIVRCTHLVRCTQNLSQRLQSHPLPCQRHRCKDQRLAGYCSSARQPQVHRILQHLIDRMQSDCNASSSSQ